MPVEESVLRALSRADVLALGPVGIAAMTLPVTRAYQRLAEVVANGGADARPHLDRLVTEGSPAGRAYGATLLSQLDPEAGRSAWRALCADRVELTTFSGCVMRRTTLAEYAAGQLHVGRSGVT